MDAVEVLVVGAGPTGLVMAAELLRYGISCRIIEKTGEPSQLSKAIVIQARTLEMFAHLKIAEPFLSEGLILKGARTISGGREIGHLSFSQIESEFPFALSLEQSKTEALLDDALKKRGGQVERSKELVDFTSQSDGIRAEVQNIVTGEIETIRTKYLIGCDGAHSFVRKKLGLTFIGTRFPDVFSLADIHINWQFPHNEIVAFLDPRGICAAFPLKEENRYRLLFQLKRLRGVLKDLSEEQHGILPPDAAAVPTLEEIQKLLHTYAGPGADAYNPVWLGNFHINSRLTSRYRVGNVFLAGDAGHVHSPIGGQGMNTGILDAFNLAWKLALVVEGRAKEELLDTYESERHRFAGKLLKGTRRLTTLATLENRILIRMRNFVVQHVMHSRPRQRKVARALSQTGLVYPRGVLVQETGRTTTGPHAGERAPNTYVTYQGKRVMLASLWQNCTGFVLLVFDDKNFIDFAHPLCPISIVVAKSPRLSENGWAIVHDATGSARQAYGVTGPCAFIIRPDLMIGLRQTPVQVEGLTSYFQTWVADGSVARQKEKESHRKSA